MNAVLICPSSRPAVNHLAATAPLAAAPLLGESLVEYWLTHLAMSGYTNVRVLANERPELISALVSAGARWGLNAEVTTEPRELTAAQAQIKYARELTASSSHEVVVLDHFPGRPQSLFNSYNDLFAGVFEWLPHARMPDRVGVHELRPGVWIGSNSRISPDAQLHAPCWIGQSVYVGARATVGPMTAIEDRAFIEPEAEISASLIGADTFVGQFAVIQDSFAFGNTLINWKSNVATVVSDSFLLSALRKPALSGHAESLFGRLAEIYSRNKDDLQMFWKHFLMNKEG
jgi:NDP-sugar pyrophosphorylase family protein